MSRSEDEAGTRFKPRPLLIKNRRAFHHATLSQPLMAMESVGGGSGGGFSLPPTWMVSPLFPSCCTPLAGSLPSSVSLGISSLPSQHLPLHTVDIQHLFADHSFSEVSYKSPLGRGGWRQRALGSQSNSDIS